MSLGALIYGISLARIQHRPNPISRGGLVNGRWENPFFESVEHLQRYPVVNLSVLEQH